MNRSPPEQAKIAHLSLFNLPYMLKACPDADYRRDTFAIVEATANVLTDEHLSVSDLRARFASDGERFTVALGDLTPEGFEFARNGYQKWLKKTDRWKGERSVVKLEAALQKEVQAHRTK